VRPDKEVGENIALRSMLTAILHEGLAGEKCGLARNISKITPRLCSFSSSDAEVANLAETSA
jgi:hypothetical protein